VAQGVGPEFKPQFHNNNKKSKKGWRLGHGSSGRAPAKRSQGHEFKPKQQQQQ
jgi:hypothetical protein